MQRMAIEEKDLLQSRRPAITNELQIMMVPPRVNLVSDNRHPHMCEVDADLMRAPGEGPRRYQGEPTERSFRPLEDTAFRDGDCTLRTHRTHEVNIRGLHLPQPQDRRIDGDLFPVRPAKADRDVTFLHPPVLHGKPRPAGSRRVLGDDHHPTGLAVETVDDGNLAPGGEFIAEEVSEPIPQGAWPTGTGGMHEETRRFINSDKVGSFSQDGEVSLIRGRHRATVDEHMVRLENVSRTYSTGDGKVRALDGVSFEIPTGDFVAITGPSGCGKSTLLNVLGGLDRVNSGQVWVGKVPLHKAGDRALTKYRRHHVGIVFQFFNLLPGMTVRENVELPLLLRGERKKIARERVNEMLDLVDLTNRAKHFPNQLSGGEMQRAALARALAGSPQLVLADEPTGNLDSGNAHRVAETLLKIASQKIVTLVIVTHSTELAGLAPNHIAMRDGKISSTTQSTY